MQFNRVQLAGYLAAPPKIRFLPSGTKVASLRMGESYKYTKNGAEEQHTNWHSLTFYGALADTAEAYETGLNLFVEGNVHQRKFAGKDGAPDRTINEIVVRTMHVIAPRAATAEEPVPEEATVADEWPTV
jgi:single stranded DNA-binding protein